MEEKDYIQTDDSLYNREIKTIPKPEPNIGIDTKDELMNNIISALNKTNKATLDTSEINSCSQLSQKRNETYDMLDNMFEDSKVAAMLKTYVADTVEMNDQGRIIWAESSNKNVGEYVNYLINTLNIEKNIYAWTTSLCKYGDLYIELYRQSEVEQEDKFFGGYKGKEQLNEDIKLNLYKKCDNYAHYVEMVNNPAEMFELMKFGKTVGYIQTETSTYNTVAGLTNNYYRYKFKRGDINIFPAGKFVHAALEDDVPRIPEEVTLFENTEDYDGNKDGETYKVRKGKSLFYDTYKIWRLLSLLESSVLLTRLTKSNTTRVWQVELGDTPKEQVPDILNRLKTLIEQKTAIKAGESINEYASTAPYDNNVFIPQYNGQGSVTVSDIGGQYNVGELPDLEYFLNALYGSRGIPKQFFGYCLRGDTKFLLLDGTTPTLKEMYDNPKKYIGKGILSCDKEGNVSPTIITEILLTRPSSDFLRITLDNGKYVDVTENHKMMLRDGTFLEANELKVGDSLMPYYEKIKKGRRFVLNNKKGKYEPQYRVVGNYKYNGIHKGNQIHHLDENKLNDDFSNLVELTREEHCRMHLDNLHITAREANRQRKNNNQKTKQAGSRIINNGIWEEWLKENQELPNGFIFGRLKFSEETKKKMSESRKETLAQHPEYKQLGGYKKGCATEETKQHLRESRHNFFNNMTPEEKENYAKARRECILKNKDLLLSRRIKNMEEKNPNRVRHNRYVRCPICGEIKTIKIFDKDYDNYLNKEKFYYCCKEHEKMINGGGKLGRSYFLYKQANNKDDIYETMRNSGDYGRKDSYFIIDTLKDKLKYIENYEPKCNHKIISIERLNIQEPAYDINVQSDNHTFALPCGIFVHNCQDAAGFSGGQSLAILSSKYGKDVKRIQSVVIQLVTDIINLFLIDKNMIGYINDFKIRMQPPTTQEEIDRREYTNNKISLTRDVMDLLGDITDASVKLNILKSMLANVITNTEVISLLQDEVEKLQKEEEEGLEPENKEQTIETIRTERESPEENDEDLSDISINVLNIEENEDNQPLDLDSETDISQEETSEDNLPNPSDLGLDLTSPESFDEE